MPPELHARILQVAEGNPLFLEEMLALVRDSAGEDLEVPPTIQALLAARLDQLDPAERAVLEHGSVEGRTFHRGAVAALAGGDGSVDQRLVALVRKELVRPDRALLAGDDAYRFRHLLIRDAAYEALPKATRADLHRRFAAWLEQHGQSLFELDEILGYHLEQAARYLDELGRPEPQLAVAAGERLARRRAPSRGAATDAVRIAPGASLTLTRPHRLDVHLELDLAWAHEQDLSVAAGIATAAAERAAAAGDGAMSSLARASASLYRLWLGSASLDDVDQFARLALPRLEEIGDHRGLATVWLVLSEVANFHGRFGDRAAACEHAIVHSRLAGEYPTQIRQLSYALVFGPQPTGMALQALDELASDSDDSEVVMNRALLLAMLDRGDEARALAADAGEKLRELGHPDDASFWLAGIALLGDGPEAAIEHQRAWCRHLESAGRDGELSTYAPQLGRLLCLVGASEEAEPLAEKGRDLGAPDDVVTQFGWRQTAALVCSARGQHAEAERLAREAVAWAERTDGLAQQGDSYSDLGEVLEVAGRRDEAIAAWREALDRYERKQVVPLARRVRERLSALREKPI